MKINRENYKLRVELSGHKKKDIAKKLNISSVLFSYYLNKKRPIPKKHIFKLEQILKTTK
jgi:predicted transcriptional regulator